MIYQLYAIFFFITLIFIFVGYFADADILKIVGYGLIFILGVMLFAPTWFGNVEKCEYLGNYTNNVYVYGDNFTGYHWDYDYSPSPGAPPDPFLFHVKSYPTYDYTCQAVENKTIGFWIAILGILGFITVFVDRKNYKMMEDD